MAYIKRQSLCGYRLSLTVRRPCGFKVPILKSPPFIIFIIVFATTFLTTMRRFLKSSASAESKVSFDHTVSNERTRICLRYSRQCILVQRLQRRITRATLQLRL